MDILVIGLGTIGTIHGYLFRQAGHRVEYLVREGSAKASVEKLEVDILDGRIDSKGSSYTDEYPVLRCSRDSYDLVFASVHGDIDDLLFVCRSVYECGKANGVQAPVFYSSYEAVASHLDG